MKLDDIRAYMARYERTLQKAIDTYQKRIDGALFNLPISGSLSGVVTTETDSVKCEFWTTPVGGEKTHIFTFEGKLLANVGNFRLDVETTLNWYLGKAHEIRDMWDLDNLTEYLIHPEEWRREVSKAIYLLKQADRQTP